MTPRRKLALGLVASAAAAAVTVPILALAAPGDPPRLPDLVTDSPDGARFDTFDPVSQAQRLLIRFNGYVHNDGDGPLDFQGNPQLPTGSDGGMDQYLWNGTGARTSDAASNPGGWTRVTTHPRNPEIKYDNSDTHSHFHVSRVAEYSLWNEAKTAQVAPGMKVGFCQYDSENVPNDGGKGPATGVYGTVLTGSFCRQYQPAATQLREGISEGYRDIYDWTLDYQWVDVSNVAPGRYVLAARMDPEDVIQEKSEANNGYAYGSTVVVPGYRARAVGPFATPYRTQTPVTLAADAFTSASGYGSTLGARSFRIETLPAGGTLKAANGTALVVGSRITGGSTLTYVPNPNFSGADGFAYSALVAANTVTYPLSPAVATASVVVGGSGATVVSLSGAPGQMQTGTQAQLSAAASTGGAVVWTTTAGSISPTGVLSAPATVPPGGTLTVRAAVADDIGAFKEITIPVVATPAADPRPVVPPPVTTAALSKPGVLVSGRNVTASVQLARAGVVEIGLYRSGRRIASCRSRALAVQSVSCRFRMAKAYDPGTVLVKASLRTDAGAVVRTQGAAGPANLRRVVVRRSARRISLAVVPQRPGFVSVAFTVRGRVVARCAGRVRPNASLTCARALPASPGTPRVGVSISFRDNQGRLVIRETTV